MPLAPAAQRSAEPGASGQRGSAGSCSMGDAGGPAWGKSLRPPIWGGGYCGAAPAAGVLVLCSGGRTPGTSVCGCRHCHEALVAMCSSGCSAAARGCRWLLRGTRLEAAGWVPSVSRAHGDPWAWAGARGNRSGGPCSAQGQAAWGQPGTGGGTGQELSRRGEGSQACGCAPARGSSGMSPPQPVGRAVAAAPALH